MFFFSMRAFCEFCFSLCVGLMCVEDGVTNTTTINIRCDGRVDVGISVGCVHPFGNVTPCG